MAAAVAVFVDDAVAVGEVVPVCEEVCVREDVRDAV